MRWFLFCKCFSCMVIGNKDMNQFSLQSSLNYLTFALTSCNTDYSGDFLNLIDAEPHNSIIDLSGNELSLIIEKTKGNIPQDIPGFQQNLIFPGKDVISVYDGRPRTEES